VATSWLDDERITAFGLFDEAHRRLEQTFSASLVARGCVSGPFFEVLARLGRTPRGRLRMSELAEALGVTSGGATRLVDRMEAASLVTRAICEDDRRVHWVRLTAEGRTQLDAALRVHLRDLEEEFATRLTVDELDALVRTLDKLRA